MSLTDTATFWLPIGVLIGVGTGAIATGVSTAAALAVGPYAHVYAFCTLATFAVAATALWLITKEHR